MNTFVENVALANGNVNAVATTTVTGTAIDKLGYNGCASTILVGNSGDTLSGSVYWTLSAEDSPDNSTWTAVAVGGLLVVDHVAGTKLKTVATHVINTLTGDSRPVTLEYLGDKRYFRVLATATGTHTNGTPIGIVNERFDPHNAPVL